MDEVQPPHRLIFCDGVANADAPLNSELLMTIMRVTVEDSGGGKTRMSIGSGFRPSGQIDCAHADN